MAKIKYSAKGALLVQEVLASNLDLYLSYSYEDELLHDHLAEWVNKELMDWLYLYTNS